MGDDNKSNRNKGSRKQEQGSRSHGRNKGKGKRNGDQRRQQGNNHSNGNNNNNSNNNRHQQPSEEERQKKEDNRWENKEIKNIHDFRFSLIRLLGMDAMFVLESLSSENGKRRIAEISNLSIAETTNGRDIGLIELAIPFLYILSREDIINTTLKSSLISTYNAFFINPRFITSVIDLLKELVNTKLSPSNLIKYKIDKSPNFNSWEDAVLPALQVVDVKLQLSGRKIDKFDKLWADDLNDICRSIRSKRGDASVSASSSASEINEPFRESIIKMEDTLDAINRKIQARTAAAEALLKAQTSAIEASKSNQKGKTSQLFPAYRVPDTIGDEEQVDDAFLNGNVADYLIPNNEKLLQVLDETNLPKRNKQTFLDPDRLKRYFFFLVREDSLIQFSCLDALMKENNLFHWDDNKMLVKRSPVRLQIKADEGSSFVIAVIYGPGMIIKPSVSKQEPRLHFLCSAKLPNGAIKIKDPSFDDVKKYWENQNGCLQPDSLLAVVWRDVTGANKSMLVKVNTSGDRSTFHPAVMVDDKKPTEFTFFVSPYNEVDEQCLIKIMLNSMTPIVFVSIRGHFFLGTEVILKSIMSTRFFSANSYVEQALLGNRDSRIRNPYENPRYNGKRCDFSAIFRRGVEPLALDLSTTTTKDLFKVLKRYTDNDQIIVDETQARGLAAALTQHVSLIVGPPGCGKTYVGVHIARVLIQNKHVFGNHPILCICYTNHALDSFLENLINTGVPRSQIVRGGNSSKNDNFKDITLSSKSREIRSKLDRFCIFGKYKELETLQNRIAQISDSLKQHANGNRNKPSFEFTEGFLKSKGLNDHVMAIKGIENDDFIITGFENPKKIWDKWVVQLKPNKDGIKDFPFEIIEDPNVYNYNQDKKVLFLSVLYNVRAERCEYELISKITELERVKKDAQHVAQTLKELQNSSDVEALRQASIVGFTTSGAAKYRDVLESLGARTIICEEAGEVLEPHILASISSKTERLILIGDHLQLRPKINLYHLEVESNKGHDLDVSLFERLIGEEEVFLEQNQQKLKNDDEFGITKLHTQWRMRPEISSLFRECKLYPYLADAPKVLSYPKVRGMKENLFFWNHNHMEGGGATNNEMSSYYNTREANMVISLVNHLIRNGYRGESQIALLTPYLGQVKLLKDLLKKTKVDIEIDEKTKEDLDNAAMNDDDDDAIENEQNQEKNSTKGPSKTSVETTTLRSCVRLSSIDNFQGEEADVVVISTVRSNKEGKTGFLRVMNRVNVMLSRAKHGMYILGNAELCEKVQNKMESSSKYSFFLLGEFLNILKARELVANYIPLRCDKHPDIEIKAQKAEDFRSFSPEGGCSQKCEGRLSCGHPCAMLCHPGPCQDKNCDKECNRPRKSCSHPCTKPCGMSCGECEEIIPRVIPICGHLEEKMKCKHAVLNDNVLGTMFKDGKLKCIKDVEFQYSNENKPHWACDHKWTVKCYTTLDSSKYPKCTKKCGGVIDGCSHTCERSCTQCSEYRKKNLGEKHMPCIKKCGKPLFCGHMCESDCHSGKSCPPCKQKCASKCSHSKCNKQCSQNCAPCVMDCDWKCLCPNKYICNAPCGAPCDRLPCDNRCPKILDCGHQCPSLCGERCPSTYDYCNQCIKAGKATKYKDHRVDLIMLTTLVEHDPNDDPIIVLDCGHPFTKSSLDGLMSLADFYDYDDTKASASSDGVRKWAFLKKFPNDFHEYKIPSCPDCRKPIIGRRYGRVINAIRLTMKNQQYKKKAERELAEIEQNFTKYGYIREIFVKKFTSVASKELILEAVFEKRPDMSKLKKQLEVLKSAENYPIQKINEAIISFERRKQTSGSELFPFRLDQTTMAKMLCVHSRMLMIDCQIMSMDLLKETLPKLADLLITRLGVRMINQIKPDPTKYNSNLVVCITNNMELALKNLKEAQTLCLTTDSWLTYHGVLGLLIEYSFGCWTIANFFEIILESQFEFPRIEQRLPIKLRTEYADQMKEYLDEIEKFDKIEINQDGIDHVKYLKKLYESVCRNGFDIDMLMVFQTLSREVGGQGHWYQCPNGHIYTIGECGGAMQEGRCIECGAAVGGHSHALTSGNVAASNFVRNATAATATRR